jgi:hypothetical protein
MATFSRPVGPERLLVHNADVTSKRLRQLDHAVLDAEPGSPVRRLLGSLAGVVAVVALLPGAILGVVSLVWIFLPGLVLAGFLVLIGAVLVVITVGSLRRRA